MLARLVVSALLFVMIERPISLRPKPARALRSVAT